MNNNIKQKSCWAAFKKCILKRMLDADLKRKRRKSKILLRHEKSEVDF